MEMGAERVGEADLQNQQEDGGGGGRALSQLTAKSLKEHASSFFREDVIAAARQGRLRTHPPDSSTFISFL